MFLPLLSNYISSKESIVNSINNHNSNQKKALYWLFIIAIASDPIVNTIQGFYLADTWEFHLSFLQIFRGIILFLMLGIIVFKNISVVGEIGLIWSSLLLSFYALFMSIYSPFPLEGVAWSFRVLYLAVIFIAAYLLTVSGDINRETLWKLAAFVLFVYLGSQIMAWYAGYGGLSSYHTELGSSGFGVGISTLSWSLCGLVPCFFFHKRWRAIDIMFVILVFSSVLLTMRRSAFLALLLVVSFIGFLRVFRQRSGRVAKLISLVFPLALLLLVLFILNGTEYGYVFMQRLEDLRPGEGTASGRYIFQKIGLEHLLNRGLIETIFGEGAGYAKVLLGMQLGVWIGMHSDWLDISICYGFVGLSCFTFFFIGVFRLFARLRNAGDNRSDGILAVFLLMGFGSMASGGILDPSFTMPYAVLGMVWANFIKGDYCET